MLNTALVAASSRTTRHHLQGVIHRRLLVITTAAAVPCLTRKHSTTTLTTRKTNTRMADNDHEQQQVDDEIERLHELALGQGSTTYVDPTTGFTVFTEKAHLERGYCCGSQCRHCPYGWINVVKRSTRNNGSVVRREPKVESGNKQAIQELLNEIEAKKKTLQQQQHRQATRRAANTKNDTTSTTAEEELKKTGGRHGGRGTAKNVPYTRGGDKGTSQLLTGERRSKQDVAFEAMGTVDELCSLIGVVHAELLEQQQFEQQQDDDDGMLECGSTELEEWLLDIMSRLFDIGSHVAKPRPKVHDDEESDADDDEIRFVADGIGGGFDYSHIEQLEDWIDQMTEELPELRSFILPTGAVAAAQLQTARCVCRRAERRVVPLVESGVCDPNALKYLNRLSDFLFSAARLVNYKQDREEIQYRRQYRGSKQRDRVVAVKAEEQQQSK